MRFYLGTNKATWLRRAKVPLFVSHRTLRSIKVRKMARTDWCLDSGGFTELSLNGKWTISPEEYVWFVTRYKNGIGRMQWASQQDYMCEDVMLEKTGLTVAEHQRLTTQNFIDLVRLAPNLPFIPVIQGQTLNDYLAHVDQFKDAGFDLSKFETVGIGSVCRRQATNEIVPIVSELKGRGIDLHGFGMKTSGLAKVGHLMKSADSMAWSLAARLTQYKRPDCHHTAPKCSDCIVYAEEWHAQIQNMVDEMMVKA
jgi:hypothetical protein